MPILNYLVQCAALIAPYSRTEQINQVMPNPVKMVESNELREDTQLKLLLGKDIASKIAHFSPQESVQLAKLTSEIQ